MVGDLQAEAETSTSFPFEENMLGTLLIQLAVIANRSDLESMLCSRVIKFMDALAGVVPYNPYIDFGNGTKEISGAGSIYFYSNLRMLRNCTVDHPAKNKKMMNMPVVDDLIIFLNNGRWISVIDCEMNISIDVGREGDQVSMKTKLLEVSKVGNVTVDDSSSLQDADLNFLKTSLTNTMSSLCDKFLSFNFSSSSVVINQSLAYTLLKQVYQVFLTVL